MKTIILASNSKARLKLLEDNGYKVITRATNIEEISKLSEPHEIIEDLALQKLNAYISTYGKPESSICLAADTMIFHRNKLIGKATTHKQAYDMLKSFSDNSHRIYSAFAMYIPEVGIKSGYDFVEIKFKKLSDLTIMNYLDCKEWEGAAGAYRIQGKGQALIDEINGEFSVAVGLPLKEISALIRLS